MLLISLKKHFKSKLFITKDNKGKECREKELHTENLDQIA